MSILSSGYMDGDGPIWPRPSSPELPSPSPLQGYQPHHQLHTHQRRQPYQPMRSQTMDPWSFPLLDAATAQHSKHKQPTKPVPKSWFTAQQYAALGDFLNKAPKVLDDIERRKQQQQQTKYATRSHASNVVDPWSFKKLSNSNPRANHAGTRNASPPQEDTQAGAESTHRFQPRRTRQEPGNKASRKAQIVESRPKDTSQQSASPAAFDRLFEDNIEAAQDVHEEADPPLHRPAEKKNKKQQRKEAKAKKAAAAKKEQMKEQSRDESPSPSVKIAGWDMDPHSKPASNASRSRHSASIAGTGGDGEGDAWGSAEVGNMFEEQPEPETSHRSQRSRGSRASKADDNEFPIPGAWVVEPQRHSKSSRSRRSSSKRDDSKLNSGLETIHEDAAFAGSTHSPAPAFGWGEEQVWRPPGQASRKESSHHSHRSRRSAVSEASHIEQPGHGSRRSSQRSATLASPAKQASMLSGPHTSYRAPTVQDAPDGWSPSWEKKGEQAQSRCSGSGRAHTKTSSGHVSAAAEVQPQRAPSQRSHHTGLASHRSPTRQSYRSKSAEKVNEWFENVPPPSISVKALSKGMSQAGSHRFSRRSHNSGQGQALARENGELPPDASVGTGYGPRKSEHGSQERHSDKRTSSGSSTKADVGVCPPSVRSARSSRRSWNAEPVNEEYGDW